jgi:ATP-dependent Clp protease ATP-binding subunit ClpC
MTSNIGARQLKDFGQGVGFGLQTAKKDSKKITQKVLLKVL